MDCRVQCEVGVFHFVLIDTYSSVDKILFFTKGNAALPLSQAKCRSKRRVCFGILRYWSVLYTLVTWIYCVTQAGLRLAV